MLDCSVTLLAVVCIYISTTDAVCNSACDLEVSYIHACTIGGDENLQFCYHTNLDAVDCKPHELKRWLVIFIYS